MDIKLQFYVLFLSRKLLTHTFLLQIQSTHTFCCKNDLSTLFCWIKSNWLYGLITAANGGDTYTYSYSYYYDGAYHTCCETGEAVPRRDIWPPFVCQNFLIFRSLGRRRGRSQLWRLLHLRSLLQSLVVFDFFPAQEIIRLAFIPKVRMNNFQETLTQGSATAMAEATMTDQEELALPRFSQDLESDQPRYLDL